MVELMKLLLDAAVDRTVKCTMPFSLWLIDLARSFSTIYHLLYIELYTSGVSNTWPSSLFCVAFSLVLLQLLNVNQVDVFFFFKCGF